MSKIQNWQRAQDENWDFPVKFARGEPFIISVPFESLDSKNKSRFKNNVEKYYPEVNGYNFDFFDGKNFWYNRQSIPFDFDGEIPLEMKFFCRDTFKFGDDKTKNALKQSTGLSKSSINFYRIMQNSGYDSAYVKVAEIEMDIRRVYAALSFVSDTLQDFLDNKWVDAKGNKKDLSYMGIWETYDFISNPQTICDPDKNYGRVRKDGELFFQNFAKSKYARLTPSDVYDLMTKDFKEYVWNRGSGVSMVENLFDFIGNHMATKEAAEVDREVTSRTKPYRSEIARETKLAEITASKERTK